MQLLWFEYPSFLRFKCRIVLFNSLLSCNFFSIFLCLKKNNLIVPNQFYGKYIHENHKQHTIPILAPATVRGRLY